jgi:ATP-dependent DNA helicase 2 subunit 2
VRAAAFFFFFAVPKKVLKVRKDGHQRARDDDDDEVLLLDKFAARTASQRAGQPSATVSSTRGYSQMRNAVPTQTQEGRRSAPPRKAAADSETETESEDEALLLDGVPARARARAEEAPSKRARPGETHGRPPPTPARSPGSDSPSSSPPPPFLPSSSPPLDEEQTGADPALAPGRIVGATYPLEDFKRNLARGDVVSKAVEDLGAVVIEVVLRPFAARRRAEMLDCMRALRDTCLKVSGPRTRQAKDAFADGARLGALVQEDEIDAWNECVLLARRRVKSG